MSGEDDGVQGKLDKVEEVRQRTEEHEHDRSPQEQRGNSFLADFVRPLFGSVSGTSGHGVQGERDSNPDDEEVVEVPATPPDEAPQWDDVLFGHPDWVPPARKRAPLAGLAAWIPQDLPDPRHVPGRPPPRRHPPTRVGPSLHTVRTRSTAWLAEAVRWLQQAGLYEVADLADAGARRLAGPTASRSRVLAVRIAAASLGLSALGRDTRSLAVHLELASAGPHLDRAERRQADKGGIPSAVALAAPTLQRQVPRDRLVLPSASHVPRGAIMTLWSALLALRSGRAHLSPDDADTTDASPGTVRDREALEDRAMAVYGEVLRLRTRTAAALEVLAFAAEPWVGDRVRPGLLATAEEVDRRSQAVLALLRQLGVGLYDADPWSIGRARAALSETARRVDGLHDQVVASLSRWTSCVVGPAGWEVPEGLIRPSGPWQDTFEVLLASQSVPAERVPPCPDDSPWMVAAFGLSAGNDRLLDALWDHGDPAVLAVLLD